MENLNDILQIPDRSLVNKKITKAFFKRNFDLTTQDRNLLDDPVAIMSMDWLASISSTNANIPVYKTEMEMYEELQVISVRTDAGGFDVNKQRIAELIQKYIPYHIVLCVYSDATFILNTCDKRINQNDAIRRTIERRYYTENMDIANPSQQQRDFLNGLSFTSLDKTSLKTLYNSYSQHIVALQASELSGMFIPRSHDRSKADMENLEKIESLEREIISLKAQAKKETQMNQRVSINTLLQQRRKEIDHLKSLITQ